MVAAIDISRSPHGAVRRRALVTGASGFVGRNLAARLVRDDWTVVCLGRRDPHIGGLTFVPLTSLTGPELRTALRGHRFDTVFHLAAYGVSPQDRDADTAFDVNVAGTAAVVHAAAESGATSLVYAGSCSEYSAAVPGETLIETHPLGASSLYGASKAAGGLWGQALARQLGLTFTWMRLFGVFGPDEAPHRLLPSIVADVMNDRPSDLSPGLQVRDVMHIDDAVEGLIQAAKAADQRMPGPYNLCSGHPARVRDLAEAIVDALGQSRTLLRFGAIPVRPGEALWLVGDGTSFARDTGFVPQLSLQAGVTLAVRSMLRARGSTL